MNHTNTQTNINSLPLWTALITPFLANGDIDFDNLTSLATAQAEVGNGILLLGSTGEGLALNAVEQLSVVKHVCQLNLSVPIMVAVGGYNLPEQINWIKQCNDLPIASYLLATPIYAKPGPEGIAQWFSALLDASSHPCMLYNVPSRSGVNLPIEALQKIQSHQNCWAMKEASGDLSTFLSYKAQCPEIALYSGEDAMMPYLAGAGVSGLVSVSANVWPKATRRYVEMSLAGEHQSLFPVWQEAVDALFQVANPIPAKVLLAQKGLLNNALLRAPLTISELATENNLNQIDQSINQWLESNQAQSFGVK